MFTKRAYSSLSLSNHSDYVNTPPLQASSFWAPSLWAAEEAFCNGDATTESSIEQCAILGTDSWQWHHIISWESQLPNPFAATNSSNCCHRIQSDTQFYWFSKTFFSIPFLMLFHSILAFDFKNKLRWCHTCARGWEREGKMNRSGLFAVCSSILLPSCSKHCIFFYSVHLTYFLSFT